MVIGCAPAEHASQMQTAVSYDSRRSAAPPLPYADVRCVLPQVCRSRGHDHRSRRAGGELFHPSSLTLTFLPPVSTGQTPAACACATALRSHSPRSPLCAFAPTDEAEASRGAEEGSNARGQAQGGGAYLGFHGQACGCAPILAGCSHRNEQHVLTARGALFVLLCRRRGCSWRRYFTGRRRTRQMRSPGLRRSERRRRPSRSRSRWTRRRPRRPSRCRRSGRRLCGTTRGTRRRRSNGR